MCADAMNRFGGRWSALMGALRSPECARQVYVSRELGGIVASLGDDVACAVSAIGILRSGLANAHDADAVRRGNSRPGQQTRSPL